MSLNAIKAKKKVSIFGVTGTIGQNTLDIIAAHPGKFDVQALCANNNVSKLAQAAIKHHAKYAVIANEEKFQDLKSALHGHDIICMSGRTGLIEAAQVPVDFGMHGIVGMAGIEPLYHALPHSKTVGIANKEPLVAAGGLILGRAKNHDTKVLPIDSEHNAIFQVFEHENKAGIVRLILTASGGPFRELTYDQMQNVTLEQALKHPNWTMGKKITIDSASMMNKALEVIEAHYLFNMPANKIDVLIHPQSIVHSMVEYIDGSILSQMGPSDMRTPIAHALAWPSRMQTSGEQLSITNSGLSLEFHKPDFNQFPALKFAYNCIEAGQAHCIALNAANEIAVEAFLTKRIGFLDIIKTIRHITDKELVCESLSDIDDVITYDQTIRAEATEFIKTL